MSHWNATSENIVMLIFIELWNVEHEGGHSAHCGQNKSYWDTAKDEHLKPFWIDIKISAQLQTKIQAFLPSTGTISNAASLNKVLDTCANIFSSG